MLLGIQTWDLSFHCERLVKQSVAVTKQAV